MFCDGVIKAIGEGNEISLVGFGNFSVSKIIQILGAIFNILWLNLSLIRKRVSFDQIL